MEDIVSEDRRTLSSVYYSLDEFADAAERRFSLGGRDFHGHFRDLPTLEETLVLARMGWDEELAEALSIAEDAIDKVTKLHEVDSFSPVWDVTGAEVDVARYLSGEPENMIDFPTAKMPKQGRVITLCASVAASHSISTETMIRRGHVLAAFAMILTQLGYACELWIDHTVRSTLSSHAATRKDVSVKVMVKGANDTVDPARIMFAFAHPAVLRRLMFAQGNGVPRSWWNAVLSSCRGYPAPCPETLPEGTIYLPELLSNRDVPDAHKGLKDLLRQTGLLSEES